MTMLILHVFDHGCCHGRSVGLEHLIQPPLLNNQRIDPSLNWGGGLWKPQKNYNITNSQVQLTIFNVLICHTRSKTQNFHCLTHVSSSAALAMFVIASSKRTELHNITHSRRQEGRHEIVA